MLKDELRLNSVQLRKQLSAEALRAASLAIANRLLALAIWDLEYFHIFLSIPEKKELDTSFIITILQGRDKQIVVPKVTGANGLTNYLLTDGTRLKKNTWKIPEPVNGLEVPHEKIEVVFVPLLAFDRRGHRVGYGKGFYDNFLAKCPKDVIKIGLSYFEVSDTIEDTDPFDVPLDYCVTPDRIYKF